MIWPNNKPSVHVDWVQTVVHALYYLQINTDKKEEVKNSYMYISDI